MDFTEPTKESESSDEDQLKKAEKAKSNQDDRDKGAKKKQKFETDEACDGSNLKHSLKLTSKQKRQQNQSSVLSGPSVSTILSDTDASGDEVQPNPPSESEMRGQESVADKRRSLCPLGYFQTQSEFNNFHDEMDNEKKSQLEEMKARIKKMCQSQTEEA